MLDFVRKHPNWSALIVFGLSLGESLPPYGTACLTISSFSNTPSSVFMETGFLTKGASGLAPFTGSKPL